MRNNEVNISILFVSYEMKILPSIYRHVTHIDDKTAKKIYRSNYDQNGGILDPDDVGKYEVAEMFDLIVYDLVLEQGGIYGCQTEFDTQATIADLVIIGK